MKQIRHGFIKLILSWPKAVLVAFLLLTLALGWQARNFSIDASPDTLLTEDNRLYAQTQVVNRRFSSQEFLLIAYEPLQEPVISRATFDDLHTLSEQLLALERVESVRSILNVPVFPEEDGLPSQGQDLSQFTIESGDYTLAELEEHLTNHPIYENLLLNEDMSATALQVLFRDDEELQELHDQIAELQASAINEEDEAGREELSDANQRQIEILNEQAAPLEQELRNARSREIDTIREILAGYDDRANTYMGGVHVLGHQLIEIISNDLVVFGAGIAIIICLVLLVLFRRLRWVAIPVLCCAASVVSTMGLFALLDIRATVISSNFVALQLILTLAIVVHLIVQYRELLRASPDLTQREAVAETLERKIGPCFFAGITTAVGFGSLVFSGIQPVISFGWMMVIAMFVSIVTSLILFPCVLLLFSSKPAREELAVARWLTRGFCNLATRHGLLVGLASLVVLGLSVMGALRLDVENSFINYFKSSTQVYQELAYIDQRFGGTTPLDLVYRIDERPEDGDIVMRAETVQVLQVIQARMAEYESIGRILSVVNVTSLGREINDDVPLTEYELTAAYWLIDENLRENLVGGFFNPEENEARINLWIRDLTEGLDRAELLESIRGDLRDLDIPETQYSLTNLFVLYQDILQRLFTSQIMTLGIVFVALTLTFLLLFRSLSVALVAIVPNIISTGTVLGVMGWLGIPLDLMTITIAAIAMGIAVDDTIHYVHRYLVEAGRSGQHDRALATARSHDSVGYAVLYTTLIVAIGFSILAFSDFVPSILFGLLTALAMLVALLCDLSLLPVLLNRFVYPRLRRASPG